MFADLETINSGSYRCVITDSDGRTVTSDYASIIPKSPGIKIIEQPQDQTRMAGDVVRLFVGAIGTKLKYQWQELVAKYNYGEEGLPFMSLEYENIEDGGKYFGTKTDELTIKTEQPPAKAE